MIGGTMDREVIYVRIDKPTKRALEQAAKEERRSMTSLCSWILYDWLEHNKAGILANTLVDSGVEYVTEEPA